MLPVVRSRLGEVGGEVLGGARLVGAVDRRDGQVGQLNTGVQLGDSRIVPLVDVALEDLSDDVSGQVELVDALKAVS